MKDAHFGCLSRCVVIVLHHWEHFTRFLESHNYVTNKLAVRVYPVILVVAAAFGIQLIHPSFVKPRE